MSLVVMRKRQWSLKREGRCWLNKWDMQEKGTRSDVRHKEMKEKVETRKWKEQGDHKSLSNGGESEFDDMVEKRLKRAKRFCVRGN